MGKHEYARTDDIIGITLRYRHINIVSAKDKEWATSCMVCNHCGTIIGFESLT